MNVAEGRTEPLRSRSFWTELSPHLTVTDIPWTGQRKAAGPHVISGGFEANGYAKFEHVVDDGLTSRLQTGLEQIDRAGLPTPFLFMYDEAWQVFEALRPYISVLLGSDHLLGGDLWAWNLAAAQGARGWAPHTDSMFNVPDLMPDGSPRYATLWVSLNEVTEHNGCMNVVPSGTGLAQSSKDVRDYGVALPVPKGSLLSWRPDIVHWSSEVSNVASEGRSSLAIFGQRSDIAPLTWDMVQVGEPVPFDFRLGMICRQLIRYQNSSLHPMLSQMHAWVPFAEREERRFSRFLGLMARVNGRRPEGKT